MGLAHTFSERESSSRIPLKESDVICKLCWSGSKRNVTWRIVTRYYQSLAAATHHHPTVTAAASKWWHFSELGQDPFFQTGLGLRSPDALQARRLFNSANPLVRSTHHQCQYQTPSKHACICKGSHLGF